MVINSPENRLKYWESEAESGSNDFEYGTKQLHWEILDPASKFLSDDLRREWRRMVATSSHPFKLHHSPEWFEHLMASGKSGRPYLAYARDEDGDLAAVVPITVERRALPLHVLRKLQFSTPARSILRVWGGQPITHSEPKAIETLVEALLSRFPSTGGLEFFGVAEDSRFFRGLENAESVRRSFLVERRPGVDRIDQISLPDSFEKFLSKYDSKKRYNLKRQLRVARESSGGDLVLERIEHPDQVSGFLADIAALNSSEGPDPSPGEDECQAEIYRDLADRGLLLGYVLKAAGQPIACLMGKEYGETFLVDWTRYNREFRNLSPGTTLLHLVIEDLIQQRRSSKVNLGYGSARCEFRSTNSSEAFLGFWLVRKTWATRSLFRLREMIRAGASACRSMVKEEPKRTPPGKSPRSADPKNQLLRCA